MGKMGAAKKLDFLIGDVIAKLGIGGCVTADDILQNFGSVSAEKFAEIIYASDLMSYKFSHSSEIRAAKNLELMISENDFSQEPHFQKIVELFHRYYKVS